MTLAHLDDSDCVVLARSGHAGASEELVHRYTPILYRLQLRVLGDRESASDAAQETFLRAFRALDSYDARRSFRAWLCTIAWNIARDQLRRRRTRRELEASRRAGASTFAPSEIVDAQAESALDALARRERRDWIQAGLLELRPTHRVLLSLREFEGMSYGELAELFDCRTGTIKSRLNRARLELKRVLLRHNPHAFLSIDKG